jgi:hypothetical protein
VKLSRAAFENRIRTRQQAKSVKMLDTLEIPAITRGHFVDSDNGETLKKYTVAELEAVQ